MKIYVTNHFWFHDHDDSAFQQRLEDALPTSRGYSKEETNIAPGADLSSMAIEIGTVIAKLYGAKLIWDGLWKLFISGKTIKDNIDAWVEIARKFRKLLAGVRKDFGRESLFLDRDAALLAAIEYAARECDGTLRSIDFRCAIAFNDHVCTEHLWTPDAFTEPQNPKHVSCYSSYAFVFRINDSSMAIVGLARNGNLLFSRTMTSTESSTADTEYYLTDG